MNSRLLMAAASLLGAGSHSPSAREFILESRGGDFLGGSFFTPGRAPYRRRKPKGKRFAMHGHKMRYHFDPATSTANRHKRHTGQNFNGEIGVYGDRAEIMRRREEYNRTAAALHAFQES